MRYSSLLGTGTLIADLVTSRFGTFVKTITLCFVEYDNISMGDYYERTCDMRAERSTRTSPRMNGHLAHAFGMYSRVQEETLEIINSGDFMAKLCLILGRSPNCRKMILTDCGNDFSSFDGDYAYQVCPHDPWRRDDLCPFKGYKLSDSDHVSFHVRPIPAYQMTPNPFHLAMSAISTAKCTITELAMIHDSDINSHAEGSFLTKDAFVMTVEQSCCLTLQLQHLLKLRMRLGEFIQELGAQAQHSHDSSPIARALSSTVNLESLFIDGNKPDYVNGPTAMSNFLGGCQFPKLSSLILKSMDSKEDELLEFLKASPDLKHFTLTNFTLLVDSWDTMAQKIRSTLRLESVMLHPLFRRRGFPPP